MLLAIPVVLPLVGGSWRASIAAWLLVVASIALLVYVFAPVALCALGLGGDCWMNARQARVTMDY